MIKTIIKNSFIVILCFTSVFPTVAAISISDGSAYVTKAEFSADLNSLSNRMAQLENSLDAKIDSLVSSYLNRNGIWNAKKVDIDYNYTELQGSDFITSWNQYENLSKIIWTEQAKVDKSGMCVITINGKGIKNGNSNYRCYLRYQGGLWPGFEDDLRITLWFNEIINGISYNRNVQQLACSTQRTTNGYPGDGGTANCVMPLPANQDTVLLGFVTKGNSIKVGMTQYVSDFQTGSSSLTGYGLGGDSRYRIQIVDCNVY